MQQGRFLADKARKAERYERPAIIPPRGPFCKRLQGFIISSNGCRIPEIRWHSMVRPHSAQADKHLKRQVEKIEKMAEMSNMEP